MKKIILVCLMLVMGVAFAQADMQKKEGKKAKSEQVTVVFETSLDCPNCAKKVENTLPFVKGVKDVKIDMLTREVTVTYDAKKCNNETIVEAFQKVDVQATPKDDK